MIKKFILTFSSLLMGLTIMLPSVALAANCKQTFLGIKPWNQYLTTVDTGDGCKIEYPAEVGDTILKVSIAIVDMLVRLAGIVAFVYLVLSGFRFVLSQGDPSKEKSARSAAFNAVIGMVIAIISTSLIGFITRSLIN